jgi:hypothetical protein
MPANPSGKLQGEGTCAMITTTDRDDEEPVFQSSYREWAEDQELRQQELDRVAVEMFLQSKLRQTDH